MLIFVSMYLRLNLIVLIIVNQATGYFTLRSHDQTSLALSLECGKIALSIEFR